MRIVGGKHSGRRIPVPRRGVRPTSERVREALMSLLGPDWGGRRVLDCFAGSGAFGFEALSRGADSVVFLEADAAACRGLAETAATFGVTEQVTIRRGDARRSIGRLKGGFDILFFDPPYADLDLLAAALTAARGLVNPGARLVAELPAKAEAPIVDGIAVVDRREYGGTAIVVLTQETQHG